MKNKVANKQTQVAASIKAIHHTNKETQRKAQQVADESVDKARVEKRKGRSNAE